MCSAKMRLYRLLHCDKTHVNLIQAVVIDNESSGLVTPRLQALITAVPCPLVSLSSQIPRK